MFNVVVYEAEGNNYNREQWREKLNNFNFAVPLLEIYTQRLPPHCWFVTTLTSTKLEQ